MTPSPQEPVPAATLTWDHPESGQHIVTNIPAEILAMLQWIVDNTFLPQYPPPPPAGATSALEPPVKKYLYPANVIYRDVIDILVPRWREQYMAGLLADARRQLAEQENVIKAQAAQAVAAVQVIGG